MNRNTLEVSWVIVQYPANSTRGKYALSLADLHIGYKLINKLRGKSDNIILAFRRGTDQGLRDGMIEATREQTKSLDAAFGIE